MNGGKIFLCPTNIKVDGPGSISKILKTHNGSFARVARAEIIKKAADDASVLGGYSSFCKLLSPELGVFGIKGNKSPDEMIKLWEFGIGDSWIVKSMKILADMHGATEIFTSITLYQNKEPLGGAGIVVADCWLSNNGKWNYRTNGASYGLFDSKNPNSVMLVMATSPWHNQEAVLIANSLKHEAGLPNVRAVTFDPAPTLSKNNFVGNKLLEDACSLLIGYGNNFKYAVIDSGVFQDAFSVPLIPVKPLKALEDMVRKRGSN